MKHTGKNQDFQNLPDCVSQYIRLIIKKMRYCKKVRVEVMAELVAHFEDELKDCKTEEEKCKKALEIINDFGDPKLLGILLRRAKKRCRPLWRTVVARTFQAVGVLIICLIVYVVWFFTGKPVITTDYIAELNRIVRPTADEGQNAAPFYIKAAEMIKDTFDEVEELAIKDFEELTDEEKKRWEQFLDENKQVFELVAEGCQRPYYWPKYQGNEKSEMISIPIPNLSDFRRIARSLTLRARLKAEKNNIEQAFEDIITCYKFGRHLKGDFFLVEQCAGIAFESLSVETLRDILSQHEIDSAALAKLQSDLEMLIVSEDFTVKFDLEKLILYDEIQRCFTDSPVGGHLYPARMIYLYNTIASIGNAQLEEVNFWYLVEKVLSSPKSSLSILLTHPDKKQTLRMTDYLYDYYNELAQKSPAQIRDEAIDVHREAMKIIKGNLLLEILAPAIDRAIEINYRAKIDVQATITIIGLLRYNHHNGRYPDTLNELISSGYLKEMPIDPYSDEPLVYRITDDGFTLYSVGKNFQDDGGVLGTDRKGRPRMSADNGDWVFWPVQK